jgi:hypothetical protein
MTCGIDVIAQRENHEDKALLRGIPVDSWLIARCLPWIGRPTRIGHGR